MLLRVAENVRQCLEYAVEAHECARSELNAERKAEFYKMELRWLRLAESYRFVEQLELFVLDGNRYRRERSYADQPRSARHKRRAVPPRKRE
jgi:hypothetical protein